MTGVISTIPKHQFVDNAGLPAVGYKLYTYLSGSLTLAASFQDQALSSANTNPVILDARGECVLWLDSTKEYKFILKTPVDVSVWSVDDISGTLPATDIIALINAQAAAQSLALSSHISSHAAALAAETGSSLIGFKQSGVGAVVRTLFDTGRDNLSPKDFGIVGDGVADDTAKLQLLINAAAGRKIDLQGLTLKVMSSISIPSNTTLENGVIDGSGMANNDTLLEAYGSMGSATSMGVISIGASSFVVASAAGLAPNDYLYLESGTIFGAGATKNGEFVKARSIAGTTITPYRRIYDNYQAAQQFYKPTMVRNITLRNIRLIGGGNGKGHTAFHANIAENVAVENCRSSFFGDRHFQAQRCLNVRFIGNHVEHSDTATGLAYGFVVANGCDNVTISNNTGNDIRHGVTIGAENGVDRNVAVVGNTFNDCTDAGIDTHPQAQFVTITGNVCGSGSTLSSIDGIVVQGTDCVISGNSVFNFSRVGILIQPLCVSSAAGDTTVCSGNSISNCMAGASDAYGISYDNQRVGVNARVSITANNVTVDTAQGIGISFEINAAGSSVNGVVVNGNNVFSRRSALRFFTAANKLARCIAVSGNVLETLDAATYDVVSLVSTTANYIERSIISGNVIYGGRYGINASNCTRTVANTNMIQNFATAAVNGLTSSADNYTT